MKIKSEKNRMSDLILKKESTPEIDLGRIRYLGTNVHCESGFKIYNGHKNISIGNNVYLTDTLINAGDSKGTIDIKDNVFFGHRVMILARGHDYKQINISRQMTIIEKAIVIKEGAWIGSGTIILPGVTIGKNSVVGAGSVVTKNIDDNSVYAGNPARLIKKIHIKSL